MSEYIKKEDLFERTINRNSAWNTITDSSGWGLEEIVNDLPTYSFPDSAENKGEITALEAENKTLRIKLENAEDVLRGLKEDLADARAELRERW